MGVSSQYWKYFLTETSSGLCYYIDSMGNLQKGNIVLDGKDYSLPEDPDGWEDIQLSYARNSTYWGINRSFSIPLKFIGDGARIVRKLFYLGRGTEQPVTLVVCKWDESNGAFMPYYSGQLDLTQNVNEVTEGVTVNVMEGGIIQLLKSYENTTIELPCDGSIPENIKILADGIKFNDVFHYQILKLASPYAGDQPLPLVYVSNDGDNIGVIKGDQNLEQPYAGYYQKSANFIFSSTQSATTVRIQGSISIKSDPSQHNTIFYMYAVTSLAQPRGVGGTDHAVGLVTGQNPQPTDPTPFFLPSKSQIVIDGQRTFDFDQTISLQPNENLFIFFFNNFSGSPIQILGGSLSVAFSSKLRPSRVWGITAPNVWKLIGQRLNALASTTDQPFNYAFTSDLLQEVERFVLTSGDAIRASTDPNYFQYYNQATVNPSNPNNTDYNQFTTQGPVLKIKLSDFFAWINAVKCASLGNQPDSNGKDSIFIESRFYVLDPSNVTMTLPQVSNFKISPDTDHLFNWLEVGYQANDYDETSGKFEYNNTSRFQPNVKALAKTLGIISPIRADSYGFELKRYNTQGGKSSTFNQGDSDKWALNIDFTSFVYDFYKASFTSNIQNTASATNTNLLLIKGMNYQSVVCGTLDGEYFINGLDFSIFMFNQPAPGVKSIAVSFTALLNGLAGDSALITMYINGVAISQWFGIVTTTNTIFNGVYSNTLFFNKGDNIYFTVDTFRTCTVQINSMSLNIGAGYFICQLAGPLTIQASITQQLISLPIITANTVVVDGNTIQVVSYGFQYFRFLSNVQDKNFNWSLAISAFIQGGTSETVTFDLWKNGVNIGHIVYNGTTAQTTINAVHNPQFSGAVGLVNYDTYWITASCTNVSCWIYSIDFLFQSGTIKAYPFLRKVYDVISGIPNPETGFNIEDFTPMRMLMANGRALRSMLFMIGNGSLSFQTADKNQFLSNTLNGVSITENASIDYHQLGNPKWLPLVFEFDTQVPYTAKQIFDASANGYISFLWKGKTYYGYPLNVTVKPALNDSQSWKLLAAETNLIPDLVELDWDGILTLQLMDSMIPYINPVHFVPLNYIKASKYNSYTMDEDWLVNRIKDYCDKNNYFAPWQLNDTIPFQCQTSGLSPATVTVLNCKGQPIGISFDLTQIVTDSVISPQSVFQGEFLASLLPDEGKYYFLWTMGVGAGTAQWISEGIWVKKLWPKSQLYDYSNSRNKLATIFNSATPFHPCIRVLSQINKYVPKSAFKTYNNEPQDSILLNAIPYDTWSLDVGFGSGIPDYLIRKIARIFDLDTVFIDGNQYTRDADSEPDIKYIDGQAKGYFKMQIRKAKNTDGITLNTAGQLEGPQQAGYVIDAAAFGTTNGQNLIQVTGD